MKVAVLSYTAGLLDGEGYISIYRQRNYVGRRNVNYQLKVMIAMCESAGLRFVQRQWGGRAHLLSNRHAPGGKRNRQILRWYLTNEKAAALLRAVKPFLKVKRRHAELALAFQTNVRKYRVHGRAGIPESVRAWRHEMYLRMAELNRRGT